MKISEYKISSVSDYNHYKDRDVIDGDIHFVNKKNLTVFIFIAMLAGCDREKIDPDQYIIPVALIASLSSEGILIKWRSDLALAT